LGLTFITATSVIILSLLEGERDFSKFPLKEEEEETGLLPK